MQKNIYHYLGLSLFIFFFDRISKMIALTHFAQHSFTVNQFLSFECVFNRGISWGMFHSENYIVFFFVSLAIIILTSTLCLHAYNNYIHDVSIIGEICIIAGSITNIIDRIMYGGVIDFILFSCGNLSWPIFNIADVAIVLGVIILIFQYEKWL